MSSKLSILSFYEEDIRKHKNLMNPILNYINDIYKQQSDEETKTVRFWDWNLKETNKFNKDNPRCDYIEEEFVHIYTDFLEMMTELHYLQEKYHKEIMIKFFIKKIKYLYKDMGMECCWYNKEIMNNFFEKAKFLLDINLNLWPSRQLIDRWNNMKD